MEDKDNFPRLEPAPMELCMLRMLQSMMRIEDDPENLFQTKTIDLKTFIPKYSKVVLVGQDTRKTFDYLNSIVQSLSFASNVRLLCISLSHALQDTSLKSCKTGDWSGWTIIMTEGLYINPRLATHWCDNCPWGHPVYPKYEIVGVENVRVLWSTLEYTFEIRGNVSFENIRFFDFRERTGALKFITFDIGEKAEVSFCDVKIAGPGKASVFATAASITLKRCSMVDVGRAFWIRESTLLLEGCHLVKADSAGEIRECQLTIRDCCITKCSRMLLTEKSGCQVTDTEFNASDNELTAFVVRSKSSLHCERCSFDGLAAAGMGFKSKSRITISNCRVTDCLAALILTENSSGQCLDSYVDCPSLMFIIQNVKGKAVFKRNEFGPRVTASPSFGIDAISNRPKHDVANATFIPQTLPASPSPKARSQLCDWLKTTSDDRRKAFSEVLKYCGWCDKGEFFKNDFSGTEDEVERMKHSYCKDCMQVCYCSKECQVADWPDHKHFCSPLAADEESDAEGELREGSGGYRPDSEELCKTSDGEVCDKNKLEARFQSLAVNESKHQKRHGKVSTIRPMSPSGNSVRSVAGTRRSSRNGQKETPENMEERIRSHVQRWLKPDLASKQAHAEPKEAAKGLK